MSSWHLGLVASVSVVLSASCQPAWGWGENGHLIVAKIAELNLEPKAKDQITKLLAVEDDVTKLNGVTSIATMRLATFADFVRHNPNYTDPYGKSAPWHFVDIPVKATYDEARDCVDKSCVIGQVERFQETLGNNDAPPAKRKEALIFLVHLVGDAHQPLHCCTRNDRGGNNLKVHFLGNAGNHLNLHSVWDDNLVHASMASVDALDAAGRLNGAIKGDDRTAWRKGTIKEWAIESHQLAVKFAYRAGSEKELADSGTVNLDKEYVDQAVPVVAKQLQKGGIRLAAVLNDALAK
jgi:hypothetical protein